MKTRFPKPGGRRYKQIVKKVTAQIEKEPGILGAVQYYRDSTGASLKDAYEFCCAIRSRLQSELEQKLTERGKK